MKKTLAILATVLAFVACSPQAPAQSSTTVGDNPTAVIEGVILGTNLNAVETALNKVDNGIFDLVINSPGGSVQTGFHFVSTMEAAKLRGVTIRCFVTEVAASMAFQILLHCNERNILSRSFLLWHRARVMLGGRGGAMTSPQLSVVARSLQDADDIIFNEVSHNISGFSHAELVYHFENETLHIGEKLANQSSSFTAYPAIPGLFEALYDKSLPRSAPSGFFDSFDFGEIVYISSKVKWENK